MVRPKKCKLIDSEPGVTYFKPRGIPLMELEEVELTVEEFEAIRLADGEEQQQVSVAKRMGVSQPTLHRLLSSGRKKIAKALSEGKAIRINGGNYILKR